MNWYERYRLYLVRRDNPQAYDGIDEPLYLDSSDFLPGEPTWEEMLTRARELVSSGAIKVVRGNKMGRKRGSRLDILDDLTRCNAVVYGRDRDPPYEMCKRRCYYRATHDGYCKLHYRTCVVNYSVGTQVGVDMPTYSDKISVTESLEPVTISSEYG